MERVIWRYNKARHKFSFSIYYEVEEKFKVWFFLLRLKYSKQKIGAK